MTGFQTDAGVSQQEAGFGFTGRFWTESFNDSMTAFAGGGRTNATKVDSMFCTFSTVATAADSAVLPAINSFPGGALSICVNNSAANAMQMFATGSDTINGVAGSTGVSHMGKSVVWYSATKAGTWIAQGLGSGYSGANQTYSYADGLSALVSGGQAGATAITTSTARFTTVTSNGDSALMMAAAAGLAITVINAGASILAIFPAGTDQINGLGASIAFAVSPGSVVDFFCTLAGQWHTLSSSTTGAPQQAYNAVSTVNASITLTGAQITGGAVETTVDMTGTQAGGVALTLPTVAQLVTAMTVAGLNPQAGMSYELDIIARDSHAYTVTTASGWTLTGTMTVNAQMRRFYLTLTSLSAAVLRSLGTVTIGVA